MRRQIPLIITFVVGWILIVAVFIPHRPMSSYDEHFSMYFDIIAVFAFILGGGNLIKIHGNKIYRRTRDWQYSIVTVFSFSIVLIIGLFKLGNPEGIAGAVDVNLQPGCSLTWNGPPPTLKYPGAEPSERNVIQAIRTWEISLQ